MLDRNGFRLNVGIILANDDGKLFWGKRVGKKEAWQFPQGGVLPYETLKETMYRELNEELGLSEKDVEILNHTKRWRYYKLPTNLRKKKHPYNKCIGQKQKWFLLKLKSHESKIDLGSAHKPEFEKWKWVDYWDPLKEVIYFKSEMYKNILEAFFKSLADHTKTNET